MNFLTEDQRNEIKSCWSGMRADVFLALKEREQNSYIKKLDDVVTEIVKKNPDLFKGSVVQRVYLKGKHNGTTI